MKHIFAFEKIEDEETIEEEMIKEYCKSNISEIIYVTEPPKDSIPVGSVKWCEKVYGKRIPNYYPSFLKDYLHRNIWKCKYNSIINNEEPIFIKPCDEYKTWNGFIFEKGKQHHPIKDNENIICSDVVHFINEWRYYIVNGQVLESAWYDGDISDADVLKGLAPPAPTLPHNLLLKLEEYNYSGVIDMGSIIKDEQSELALVESCHPYAIGWYLESDSYKNYAKFLIESDLYLKNDRIIK